MTNITLLCANRPRLLKQALDSIGDLSNATVTIRDAGMNKQVRAIAYPFAWEKTIPPSRRTYYQGTGPLGTGQARNHVVRLSEEYWGRGDYLYLSDDDVYWTDPDWLAKLVYAYERTRSLGYRVLGCYNHPYNQPVGWVKYPISPPMEYGALPSGTELSMRTIEVGMAYEVYALASQSMLMDWETWDTFGPFCDTPAGKVCQSEDVDFSNRIREAGYKVGVISPSLLVNTGITNSFGEHIPGWELVKSQAPEGVLCE